MKNSGMFFLLHRDQSNLIPLDPEAYIQQALELLTSDCYLEKGMGLVGPDRAHACRDFLQRYLQPPSEKLPYPALLFDGQLENPSGSGSEPYLIPVLADPKKLIQALDRLRSLKSFPSPKAVNATTGPRAHQVRFHLRLPRPTLETRATSARPTAPSVATRSNPKTSPPISSSPKILDHKFPDRTHPSP
jgi:hypothetical protein